MCFTFSLTDNPSSQPQYTKAECQVHLFTIFQILFFLSFSLYTSRTALIQPSFSGLFVTCAYFPEITNKQRFVKIVNITTEVTCKGDN